MRDQQKVVIALDIGGTKTALGIVDENCEVSHTSEVAVHGNPDFWNEIAETVKSLREIAGNDLAGVGIGSAGPLHLQEGAISPVNIPSWRKFPIVSEIAEITGTKEVSLHGDAMALAHAVHQLYAWGTTAQVVRYLLVFCVSVWLLIVGAVCS